MTPSEKDINFVGAEKAIWKLNTADITAPWSLNTALCGSSVHPAGHAQVGPRKGGFVVLSKYFTTASVTTASDEFLNISLCLDEHPLNARPLTPLSGNNT